MELVKKLKSLEVAWRIKEALRDKAFWQVIEVRHMNCSGNVGAYSPRGVACLKEKLRAMWETDFTTAYDVCAYVWGTYCSPLYDMAWSCAAAIPPLQGFVTAVSPHPNDWEVVLDDKDTGSMKGHLSAFRGVHLDQSIHHSQQCMKKQEENPCSKTQSLDGFLVLLVFLKQSHIPV